MSQRSKRKHGPDLKCSPNCRDCNPICSRCGGLGIIWVDLSELDCPKCSVRNAMSDILNTHYKTFKKLKESGD